MATCHGGTGQPPEKDPNPQEQDVNVPSEYQEDIDDFENVEHEHHAWFRDLTNEIDYLWHKVEANETWPTEAISHLEHELNRLTLTLHPSALPELLDEVLQQYTETICTAQNKTSFVNTLLQDITIFNGNDSSQLEDWLIDIKTISDLTSKSRTKLAQAKSKGLIWTLISEALSSDKNWDKIKDLLHLKFVIQIFIHQSGISWKFTKMKGNL